jgi:MATE family multidrug resistance protein
MSELRSRIIVELRALGRLAGPLVAHNLAVAAMMTVDTIMAGQLSAADLGAVAVGSAIFWPPFGFIMGMLMALTATVAHLYGGGATTQVGHYLRQANWLALAAAVVGMALFWSAEPFLTWIGTAPELVPRTVGYLQALSLGMPAVCLYQVQRFTSEGIGRTSPLISMAVIGVVCNIIGNWIFMWGNLGAPELGATGCGLATALSWWVMYVVLRRHLRRHAYYAPFALVAPFERPSGPELRELVHLGLPIGVMVFMESSLFTAAALILGTLGAEIVAGHQIALNWAAFMFMVPLGLGMAATIRVGHANGAGLRDAARFRGWIGIGSAVGFMAGSALFVLLARGVIVDVYTKDAAVAAVAYALLVWAAAFQLADGLQVSTASVLRGYKDTRIPALITVLAYWGVGLTACWWLGLELGLGPEGVWMGMTLSLVAAAGLLVWRFARISR